MEPMQYNLYVCVNLLLYGSCVYFTDYDLFGLFQILLAEDRRHIYPSDLEAWCTVHGTGREKANFCFTFSLY